MDKKFVTKDSGERRDFGTGSVRDRAVGKGRFDLIPMMPIRRLADLYERGAVKYGESNWRKGQPLMASFIDSAFRHLTQLIGGEPTEDHAASVLWNIVGYMWTLDAIERGLLPKSLDDRLPPDAQYAAPTTAGTGVMQMSACRSGRAIHVTAWERGGCAVCGGINRDTMPVAHNTCWAKTTYEDKDDFFKVIR